MSNKLKLTIFYFARALGFFALFRVLTRSQLRILCYHGGAIGDESEYNGKLFFSRNMFEKRILWLEKKGFNVVPLDNVIEPTKERRTALPLATVITFDDGWHSTWSELLPVLSKLGKPSTLYLCTSHFADGTPVAAVTIRYIVWKSPLKIVFLRGFCVTIDGEYNLRDPMSREDLVRKIVAWIDNFREDFEKVFGAMEQFSESMGVMAKDLQLRSRRFQYLTGDELRTLTSLGCAVELHGHIHNYPNGDPEALQKDLQHCFDVIQGMGLPKPKHYCYPSGNFDSEAPAVLSRLGVLSATTCIPGLISKGGNIHQYFLPRFLDGGDVNMLEFEAEMSGFSEFLRRCTGRVINVA